MDDDRTAIGLLRHDLQYRRNKIRESLEEHEPLVGNPLSYFDDRDTVVAYFAVANELVKLYQELLFQLKFIQEDYRGSVTGNMGAKTISDILNAHDVLDDQLKTDCKDVIEFRRRLVHETPQAILDVSLEELSDMIEASERAIDGLQTLIIDLQDDSSVVL